MTHTWLPPGDWFHFDNDDLGAAPPGEGLALLVSAEGRVSGIVAVGPRLGLRLLEPGVVDTWAVDQVHTADGHMLRVGTVDIRDWTGDRLVDVGVAAVCRVGYFAPDRVFVVGAVVPDARPDPVAELAAGRVTVQIEPRLSTGDRPVLAGVSVHPPAAAPDAPAGPPPVRRVWS
ncbi:hypothetical protein [Umezawaea sp. Da 62-37]|uniref:hypothetical protein n=1 Tax=Umezawaea sp. Da 62-37 TaxID=3075927 RepID=UPI0028F72F4D|nr:hypothetical protein [Umezawaea sp. Da 62-37]WNV86672.1 hypothetical protein RM788_52595 [Umezawaea sp. Da 62-37]WNV86745.1 hypothetical protein RM788_00210 [Umezawaea sp. Da 62-37]